MKRKMRSKAYNSVPTWAGRAQVTISIHLSEGGKRRTKCAGGRYYKGGAALYSWCCPAIAGIRAGTLFTTLLLICHPYVSGAEKILTVTSWPERPRTLARCQKLQWCVVGSNGHLCIQCGYWAKALSQGHWHWNQQHFGAQSQLMYQYHFTARSLAKYQYLVQCGGGTTYICLYKWAKPYTMGGLFQEIISAMTQFCIQEAGGLFQGMLTEGKTVVQGVAVVWPGERREVKESAQHILSSPKRMCRLPPI